MLKHNGDIITSKEDYDIIACKECGFYHLDPIPSEDIYSTKYYQEEKPHALERIKEDARWWELVYRERIDLFESIIHWTRRRLLDVGSGYGHFLDYATRRGWFSIGIEPSKSAVKYSLNRQLNVQTGFFDAPLRAPFDVIHMNEVLEHVPDPKQMLSVAWESLAQGGIVCVVVPNDFNPLQQSDEAYWVSVPWHVNYFNIESLTTLMQKAGFQIIHQEATFPMELFLYMGLNYVDHDEVGRRVHGFRKEFEINLDDHGLRDFKKTLYQAFLSLGIGREIMMIGQKQ